MKRLFKYILPVLLSGMACVSCSDDDAKAPSQPDFIIVKLEEPYSIQMGEMFEISVPDEGTADHFQWILPEMLSVINGENSARLQVVGLVDGTIPAGVISVTAINSAGSSSPRTLWRDIVITGLPPRPAYVQSSIIGSLTVDKDEEFAIYVPEEDNVATYEWSVPDKLTIVSGGNTSRVIVKATEKSFNIPKNSITVETVSKTGLSQTYSFEKMICVLPTDGYPAKRYGNKTWMTTNLNYAGTDGTVGLPATDDTDGAVFGRFYLWSEIMTGVSAGDNPYVYNSKGTDDMGNSYTFNDGKDSYNVQIQGICPEGWHVPNAYDLYDLVAGVADDYGLRKSNIESVVESLSGIYVVDNRETSPMSPKNLTDHGFIGSYLRGSRPEAEGGMWKASSTAVDNGTMFNLTSASGKFPAGKYPMYFPDEIEKVGFKILPGGRYDTNGTYHQQGQYSYHWTATVTSNNGHYRFTIGNGNCNFSTYAETAARRLNLRCVANY